MFGFNPEEKVVFVVVVVVVAVVAAVAEVKYRKKSETVAKLEN